MHYIGEHLFPGQFGQFMVVLSLVASLVACVAYFKSTNATVLAEAASWKKFARFAFLIDAVSVFSIFVTIFILVSNHYFEYFYAWDHSDRSLEPKFLLSSIWEGQEGSFLLWTLWHAVLGLILMGTSKKWEAPVMTVVSFAQVCLATMILGVYIFNIKVGSTPFILLRDSTIMPATNLSADYLQRIPDGKGLNQLLQNYWMVIHPPILFLGFASTTIPFAFAIAGLWKKDYGSWTKQALPWSLFSSGILGLGIMMGAKWAYESLTFGGYWAWDPVENASLVPWLVMVAGLHTQVIYNSTGHSLRATYFFFIMSFLLILYSTYLTRSGDLQDTSVHAFVDSGMNWQLRAFVFVFLIPSAILYISRYKKIPHVVKEESSWSREFWMFIASLVLFLSAISIIIPTSFPIFKKLFGANWDIGEEKEFAYNRIQIFVAIIIGVLAAITQYLKYKTTAKRYFAKKILVPTLISLAISAAISLFGKINYEKFGTGFLVAIHVAIFAAVYSIVANTGYIWAGLNGRLKAAGASVAHVGFGMFLVGVLISSSKKQTLSINTFNPLNFGEAKEKGVDNLTLFQGLKTDMGDYWVTYVKDTTEDGKKTTFAIDMERKDGKDHFTLYPDFIKTGKGQEGFANNPDSKHYWNRDIFTYLNYSSKLLDGPDTAQFHTQPMKIGDTLFYSAGFIIFDSVTVNPHTGKYKFNPTDTALMANLSIFSKEGRKESLHPLYYIENSSTRLIADTSFNEGLILSLVKVADNKHLQIGVKESSKLAPFVALKVLRFPFINLVWLGILVMLVGIVMSIFRRISLSKG